MSGIDQSKIRNFCIIAHIDHGKSTLADRIIEMTGLLTSREMQSQVLDNMKLATAKAIAGLVPDEELNENNILPEAFDPRVADVVSRAVKELI